MHYIYSDCPHLGRKTQTGRNSKVGGREKGGQDGMGLQRWKNDTGKKNQ